MSETCGAGAVAGIDLRQFHEIFFEEAGENLAQMEQLLLHIDIDAVADEALHAIFRCAHSIKGGAATFGFADVTEMTHQMETLLDRLRRHELAPSADMVDALLQAGDALRSQLERHRGAGSDGPDTGELLARMRELAGAATGIAAAAAAGGRGSGAHARDARARSAPAGADDRAAAGSPRRRRPGRALR
jgi:two-component system chemotaxis sensor kinase CheA